MEVLCAGLKLCPKLYMSPDLIIDPLIPSMEWIEIPATHRFGIMPKCLQMPHPFSCHATEAKNKNQKFSWPTIQTVQRTKRVHVHT